MKPLDSLLKALPLLLGGALLFSLASGLGAYALAPDGTYADYTTQGVSHDWHLYQWFFQIGPNGWRLLTFFGLLTGLFKAVFVAPFVLVASAVFAWLSPWFRGWLIRKKSLAFWAIVFVLGFAEGVVETIINGRNPGIP